jgi:hypothetical protein
VLESKEASLEDRPFQEVVQADLLDLHAEIVLTMNLIVDGFFDEEEALSVDVHAVGEDSVEVVKGGRGDSSLVVLDAVWVREGNLPGRGEEVLDHVVTREGKHVVHVVRVGDELVGVGHWQGELTGGSRHTSRPLEAVEGVQLCSELARGTLTGVEGHPRLVLVVLDHRSRLLGRSKLSKLVLGHALLLLRRLAGLVLVARVVYGMLALSLSRLAMVLVSDFLGLVLPLLANDAGYMKLVKALQMWNGYYSQMALL